MEQLYLLIQQIYKDLSILSNYTPKEREELLEGYLGFLAEIKDLIVALSRVVEGNTSWGWKIDWGFLPWQLRTYQQQRGLNLQAGWEDKVDFSLDLYRDRPVESLRFMVPMGPPEPLKPEDLDIVESRSEVRTDICQLHSIRHERLIAPREFIPIDSSSSSEVRDSDLDSMPELEDEVDTGTIEIPLWMVPNGVLIAFRGRRMTFEREQGPPWQEVLAQMLEEQESTAADN